MPFEDIQRIKDEDLRQLELKLNGPPLFEYLAVFIRDPQKSQQYWLRKIHVKEDSVKLGKREKVKKIPYVDVETLNLGPVYTKPCPQKLLSRAVKEIAEYEEILGKHEDPRMRSLQAVVGVAEYKGSKTLTMDEIITLVGLKYYQMRTLYLSWQL